MGGSVRLRRNAVRLVSDHCPACVGLLSGTDRKPCPPSPKCAFKCQEALWIQLARRVRSLSDLHVGERWDASRQRVRRCYRDFSPKAALFFGHWLASGLGIGGQGIARAEEAERERKAKEGRELREALAKLV